MALLPGDKCPCWGHDTSRIGRVDRWVNSSIKVELSEYLRGLQAKDFINSIDKIKRKDTPKGKNAKLVALKLKGLTSTLLKQLKKIRTRKRKLKITNSKHTKNKIQKQFFPFNYTETLCQKFQNLSERSWSIVSLNQFIAGLGLHHQIVLLPEFVPCHEDVRVDLEGQIFPTRGE